MLTVLGASQLIYTQSTRNSVPYYNEQIKQQAQRTATDGANSQSLPLIAQPSSCFFSPPLPLLLVQQEHRFCRWTIHTVSRSLLLRQFNDQI